MFDKILNILEIIVNIILVLIRIAFIISLIYCLITGTDFITSESVKFVITWLIIDLVNFIVKNLTKKTF